VSPSLPHIPHLPSSRQTEPDRPANPSPPTTARHVVVIGASMAGLPMAAAFARHARKVTLIERDDLPDGVARRPGVPQARHAHGLQGGGRKALERLLPGITAEWVGAGANLVPSEHVVARVGHGWFPTTDKGEPMVCASRDLIEAVVRRRVLSIPNVEVRDGTEVVGLTTDDSGTRVTGVELRPRRPGDWPVEHLEADLVVDASGRRSPAPDWIEALGYGRPEREEVDAGVVYGTRVFRRPREAQPQLVITLPAVPTERRFGIVTPIEDDRWLVTIGGAGGDEPTTDPSHYEAFAAGLSDPIVHRFLQDAEPVSPIWSYHRTNNVRHRYDRLAGWPAGFTVVGDAACAFNPVYGQGMSVAALTAVAVDDLLATTHARDAAEPIQRAAHRVADGAWMMATGQDKRYPHVGLRQPLADRVVNRYFDRLARVATVDERVQLAFRRVISMEAAPPSVFRPAVAWRVLRPRSIPETPAPIADIGVPAGAAPTSAPAAATDEPTLVGATR